MKRKLLKQIEWDVLTAWVINWAATMPCTKQLQRGGSEAVIAMVGW